MVGLRPEGCITDLRNTRMETSGGYIRMEEPLEGGQGPERAAAPYMDGMDFYCYYYYYYNITKYIITNILLDVKKYD